MTNLTDLVEVKLVWEGADDALDDGAEREWATPEQLIVPLKSRINSLSQRGINSNCINLHVRIKKKLLNNS